ncbi:unnamed protein product [Adineta steineri]|uniref:Bulb-type lectin domain-containing protein n=1 Tax=Adineta steineri TaxID=433720 RepID=A0A819UKJ3_9BILA|nr:unnamed protein product [Adineta steineri]
MELWLYLLLLQLSLAANISFAVPVESATENETGQALDYLTKYGYNTCRNSTNMACSVDLSSMLKKFQEFYKLEETGTLDAATKQIMNKPRCGNADVLRASQLNTYLKWSKKSLTWSLRGNPDQLSFAKTESIMQWAFQHWTDHIPVKIKQTCSKCNANIVIDFVRKDHGDMHSFDGPGRTLAHAFFPEDGRIHFDKDETWNDGSNSNQRIWESATGGRGTSPYHAILETDGNFVVYDGSHSAIWATNTQEKTVYTYLVMQDDGNLVLYKRPILPERIWATGTQQKSDTYTTTSAPTTLKTTTSAPTTLKTTTAAPTTLKTTTAAPTTLKTTTAAPTTLKTTTAAPEDETSTKYIVESFKQAFPNDIIVAYKFKSGGAGWFYGTRLLRVNLKDGYWLQIYKLSKSAGNYVTSDEIKSTANSFINKTKGEVDNIKRRDILWNELKNAFPSHYVNIFIFDDSDWTRNGQNTKGSAYFEKNYGSEVDIVLT